MAPSGDSTTYSTATDIRFAARRDRNDHTKVFLSVRHGHETQCRSLLVFITLAPLPHESASDIAPVAELKESLQPQGVELVLLSSRKRSLNTVCYGETRYQFGLPIDLDGLKSRSVISKRQVDEWKLDQEMRALHEK